MLGATRRRPLRLTVTAGPAGLDVDVRDGRALDAEARSRLAALADAADLARLSWDGEPVAVRRPPVQTMGRAQVVPPPGGFLQATAEGAAALVASAREAVGNARRVADLFAGCGTFALPLAEATEVRAVEADAAMLAALDAAWRGASGLRRIATEARDLFRRPLLAPELDPPRAGAEAQARELARAKVGRVAMASCDPATFARDAAILVAGGYRLDWVRPVDQFRWSGHVELAAAFRREPVSRRSARPSSR
jgi:23S rRNA (uracil1939-C5)-methyltransferase